MKMKFKLMIQSLSPLFLLTLIKNFSFQTTNDVKTFDCNDFISENIVLLCVSAFCVIWIVISLFLYFQFGAFKWIDKKQGFTVTRIHEDKDAGLNYFLTLIIPLLLDNLNTLQGAITFACIVFMICVLLYRTTLFYANPILTMLGYRIYSFSFEDNPDCPKTVYIGLCKGSIMEKQSIEYKVIDASNNVLYIKGM